MSAEPLKKLTGNKAKLLDLLNATGADKLQHLRCPLHADEHGSLSVNEKDGTWLWYCHVCQTGGDLINLYARLNNCSNEDAVRRLAPRTNVLTGSQSVKPVKFHRTLDSLKAAAESVAKAQNGRVVNFYEYPNGYYKFRIELPSGKKQYLQARAVGDGFVMKGLDGRTPLYRVPSADHVVVCEGEKCVEQFEALGIVATTNAGGGGAASKADWTHLAGKSVRVWRDNDLVGATHQKDVIAELSKLSPPAKIQVVDVSALGLPAHGDIVEYVDALRADGKDDAEIHASVLAVLASAKPVEIKENPWSIKSLYRFDVRHDPTCILGERLICKSGAFVINAQTGIGKSVLITQLGITWALGLPFFGGLRPSRPLKVRIIQSENDLGDAAEMVQGIIRVSRWEQHLDQISRNVKIERVVDKAGDEFLKWLSGTTIDEDITVIDPLFAYAGCDVSNQKDMSLFLRNGLNSIAVQTGTAFGIVHHCRKPPQEKDEKQRGPNEFTYAGHGSAELSNWARAIFALEESGDDYQLIAAKRGARAGFFDIDGNETRFLRLAHSVGDLCWVRTVTLSPKDEAVEATVKELMCNLQPDFVGDRHDLRKFVQKQLPCSRKTVFKQGTDANRIWLRLQALMQDKLTPGTFRCHPQSPTVTPQSPTAQVTGSHPSPPPYLRRGGDCNCQTAAETRLWSDCEVTTDATGEPTDINQTRYREN